MDVNNILLIPELGWVEWTGQDPWKDLSLPPRMVDGEKIKCRASMSELSSSAGYTGPIMGCNISWLWFVLRMFSMIDWSSTFETNVITNCPKQWGACEIGLNRLPCQTDLNRSFWQQVNMVAPQVLNIEACPFVQYCLMVSEYGRFNTKVRYCLVVVIWKSSMFGTKVANQRSFRKLHQMFQNVNRV